MGETTAVLNILQENMCTKWKSFLVIHLATTGLQTKFGMLMRLHMYEQKGGGAENLKLNFFFFI